MEHCVRVLQSNLQSSPRSVHQIVLMVHFVRIVQSIPTSVLQVYSMQRRSNQVLLVTQIFYTDFLGVITAINLMINCMALDIRYLWNCGTYLKNHVAAQPDGSFLQLLNYCMQKLLKVLTSRLNRESLLFRVQILFTYYCSMNGFCDINIIIHESNLCANLNYPNYIKHNTYINTCSGSSHGLWL